MEKIAELERRLTLLENMVNLLASEKLSHNKHTYNKYVVVVKNEELCDCVVLDLENQMSSIDDMSVNSRPNVRYIKFVNNSDYEVVVITSEFYGRWKYSHSNHYTVTYNQLVDELHKGGVING